MQSRSVVLKLALVGAVLATLQSTAAIASDPTITAESPIVVVGPGEEVNEKGEMNNIALAENDIDDGAKDDDDTGSIHDGAHDEVDEDENNNTESVQDQQEQGHNESGQQDN